MALAEMASPSLEIYSEQQANNVKTIARTLEFVALAEKSLEDTDKPVVVYEECADGEKRKVVVDKDMVKMWKGIAFGAARELSLDGHQDVVEKIVFDFKNK